MSFDKDKVQDAVESRVKKFPLPFVIAIGVVAVMAAALLLTDIGRAIFGGG